MFERQRQTAVWNVYITVSLKVRAITFFVCSCVHNLEVQVFSGTIAPETPIFFSSEEKHQRECAETEREKKKTGKKNLRKVRKAALINIDTWKWNIVNKQSMYTV